MFRTGSYDKFQSTLPRGSDFFLPSGQLWPTISIHAPSRERQIPDYYLKLFERISIHAPSRERRLDPFAAKASKMYFNPRSLAGATNLIRMLFWSLWISIHAPSRERPDKQPQMRNCLLISIHAPSRERLPADNSCGWSCGNFNPRSLAGATARNDVFRRICRFQSTLPRGSDGLVDHF